MTRKDYELIARVFKIATTDASAHEPTALLVITPIARLMAINLGRDNPRFDRERFLVACGVTQ